MSGPLSLGRVTGSLATVHNENSASLATANFDFTLIKVEAPVEFGGLGTTISRKRKVDAEEGALHRTARKLGALFGERLPPTEDLFRAYGTRVSEISSMSSINPQQGSDRESIFGSHIGADTASIWAAVTSGSAAIAAHLLGCMLARVFTGPEAISAWVELVEKQKQWIRNKQGDALFTHEHEAALSAAKQDISRNDLAKWDASARAWLQSADQAKALQHKQTMLILDNAGIPINSDPTTYDSIMKAWTVALEAINNLVKGIPQRVHDGAALLAISSWHLYPDMIVYTEDGVEVRQKDPLFDRAALLTLGLQHIRNEEKSVYWSLPLACLQYYGHPVRASRSVGQDNARVTCQQFSYIIMGCLFARWGTFASTNEEGMKWIDRIGTVLNLESSTQHRSKGSYKLTWLIYLLTSARDYVYCEESEKRVLNQLMNLGRRRSTFLQPASITPAPAFGLAHINVLLTVLKSEQGRVNLLRKLASHLKMNPSQFLIKYRTNDNIPSEYAGISAIRRTPPKRRRDGEGKEEDTLPKCIRWIVLSDNQLARCARGSDFRDLPRAAVMLQRLKEESEHFIRQPVDIQNTGNAQNQEDQRRRQIDELEKMIQIAQRIVEIEELGEICLPIAERQIRIKSRQGFLGAEVELRLVISMANDFVEASIDILHKLRNDAFITEAALCRYFAGDIDGSFCSITQESVPKISNLLLSPEVIEELFSESKFSKEKLSDHLSMWGLRSGSQFRMDNFYNLAVNLRAYTIMTGVYRLLPGASISTLVLSQPLEQAKWIPSSDPEISPSLTLSQAFACIAMFESGTCNVDPQALSEVFAMSSGNSLYVAGTLLCDPYEEPGPAEIRRVVGNIGRAGISFLISPPEVKVREPDPEKWMSINHGTFDGKLEDHFRKTSVHLSFTEYEIPLVSYEYSRHTIDHAVLLIETLVSVYNGGEWIAEVDVLKTLRDSGVTTRALPSFHEQHIAEESQGPCMMNYEGTLRNNPVIAATSIENWDELLEAPETGCIAVRAHKNWLARLATSSVCSERGFKVVILPSNVCWRCVAEVFKLKEYVSPLHKVAMIC